MSGDIKHREILYVPMCTREGVGPWFAVKFMRHRKMDARHEFVMECAVDGDWESLKKEGWRIVRVEVQS